MLLNTNTGYGITKDFKSITTGMSWVALKSELDLRPPRSDEHFGSQQAETYVNMAWFL